MTAVQQWWMGVGQHNALHVPPLSIEAELYISFAQSDPAGWKDESVHQSTLTLTPNLGMFSPSVGGGPGGHFGGRVAQVHPGAGDFTYYDDHASAVVGRQINFAAEDFFIEFRCNLDAGRVPVTQGFCVLSNRTAWSGGGFFLEFHGNNFDGSALKCFFSAIDENGFPKESFFELHQDTPYVVAYSRVGHDLRMFVNGAIVDSQFNLFGSGPGPGLALEDSSADLRLFAVDSGGSAPHPQLVQSYDGVISELIILKGPGSGRATAYTPRTTSYL